ncbi:MAG TPA: tetratricopeptide repeat protein [Micropepsaceae bacterium]|nr:tetratricopeptide repeat protein [Micropepsaceae bacterium]
MNEAFSLYRKGSVAEAAAACRQIIASDSGNADALHLLGIIEAQTGNAPGALNLIDRAIFIDAENFRFHFNRSLVLQQLGRLDEALVSCDTALRLKPDYARAVNSRGVILQGLKRIDEALDSYDRAAAMQPDFAEAFVNRGILLQERDLLTEALASYDRAIAINPRYAEAYNNRGLVLQRLNRFGDALNSFDRAIGLKPGYAEALNNRGFILHRLGRFEDAIASYQSALALAPDFLDALNNIGVSFHRVNRFEEALASYDRALTIKPDCSEALCNRGQVLLVQGEISAAIACLKSAAEITHNPAVHSAFIFGLNFDPSASASSKQAERRNWASRYAQGLVPSIVSHNNDGDPDRPIRLGYVSSYFRRSASAQSFGGVIANHGQGFHVTCYSDTTIMDDVTETIRHRADQWRDTAGLPDQQLADLIRRDRIDILIDLVGHMAGNRLLVFARKPAPIQVTAWGEPTGTGLAVMDYLLADRTLVPECEAPLLAERIVHLPNFLGFWPPGSIPPPAPLPALRNGHVTFGCFNRLEKLSPAVLTAWTAILRDMPTARLTLKDKALENAQQCDRLRRVFADNGVSPDWLTLLPESDSDTHFATYNEIDIALDPFPHSGGMTTLDALWMGVPVLTCPGETISSRLAAASLANLGLHEFICPDRESYIAAALAMANHLERLSDLRSTLRGLMATSDFGDPEKYSRAVENAYRHMWRKCCTAPAV